MDKYNPQDDLSFYIHDPGTINSAERKRDRTIKNEVVRLFKERNPHENIDNFLSKRENYVAWYQYCERNLQNAGKIEPLSAAELARRRIDNSEFEGSEEEGFAYDDYEDEEFIDDEDEDEDD